MPLYSHPVEIRDNERASCKSGHTEYREMAFRLDGSIRHCSDNTITRKMSSANASTIKIVDKPRGKTVAWNYYAKAKSADALSRQTIQPTLLVNIVYTY